MQHVLVLDDDEVMRDLLDALLSLEGYQVTCIASGEEATRLLGTAEPFDLVLTDLNMPGLEGEALAATLRSALPGNCLLLGMSGREPAGRTRDYLDGFLRKPFNQIDLQEALRNAHHQRSSRGTNPQASISRDAPDRPESDGVSGAVALNEEIYSSLVKVIPAAQLGELYDLTLGDIAKRHRRMTEAAAADDLAAVQREAHAVKGSCGMVGASELQNLAAAVEDGTSLNLAALEEIPAACARLRRMLDTKLQTA